LRLKAHHQKNVLEAKIWSSHR